MSKRDNLRDFFEDLISTLKLRTVETGSIRPKDIPTFIGNIRKEDAGGFFPNLTCSMSNGVRGITTVIIHKDVVEIKDNAYSGLSSINTINLPEGLRAILQNAFSGTGLVNIKFPQSLEKIGPGAFSNCTKLETITFPDGIVDIGNNNFESTVWYKNQLKDEGEGVIYAGRVAYKYKGTTPTEITLNKDAKAIAWQAFAYHASTNPTARNLKEIIGVGIQLVGDYAFNGCNKLERVFFGGDDLILSTGAFSNCSNISEVTLQNVKSIGESCFFNCGEIINFNILNDSWDDNNPPVVSTSAFKNTTVTFYVRENLIEKWRTILNSDNIQPYSEVP